MVDIENVMETLIQISEEKYKALEKIYKFTQEQTKVIMNEDIDTLNELIDKKQMEINTIQSLDVKFEKIVDDLKLVYEIKKLDELKVCQEEVKRIQYIINMIMNKVRQIRDVEVDNSNELRKLKDQLENKIINLKSGKKAVSSYGYSNIQVPVYFDKNK